MSCVRVLPFVNQKGGCGKTTCVINVAGELSRRGWRVLVFDLDPQAHATMGFGVANEGLDAFDLLMGNALLEQVICDVDGGLRLVPSSRRLAGFEDTALRRLQPEQVLAKCLEGYRKSADFVLIDCPARADGLLTANALVAATTAILVIETGAFSLQGALAALDVLDETCERHGTTFGLRALATLYDGRTRFAREFLIALQARFGELLLDACIHNSVRLREAAAIGIPIHDHAPRSRAATDFKALADELEALESGTPQARDWLCPRHVGEAVIRRSRASSAELW